MNKRILSVFDGHEAICIHHGSQGSHSSAQTRAVSNDSQFKSFATAYFAKFYAKKLRTAKMSCFEWLKMSVSCDYFECTKLLH